MTSVAQPATAYPFAKVAVAEDSGRFGGRVRPPGDKSISHRALILGGLAVGETRIEGLLEGEDVLCTAESMRRLGADILRLEDGAWRVRGRGTGGLAEPSQILDCGNSGTGCRLLMGVAAGHPFTSFFTGDASLSGRPMRRVSEPLAKMGATILARSGGRLPLAVTGSPQPLPIRYELPVASAQVKSAILLAGLQAPGHTVIIEPHPSRDHSERMLRRFGAKVTTETGDKGAAVVVLEGQPELAGCLLRVPADPSSAAFPLVAAAILPGSRLTVENVCLNPLRAGLFETLREMGASLTELDRRDQDGEIVADLMVEGGSLKGIEVPAERAPRMIDEYPILAVAAACAEGRTVMRGLAELRVKESDRLAAVAAGLKANGVEVEELPDGLIVQGCGGPPPGGGRVATHLDHRIAMSFLVLGLASARPVTVDDTAMINTSFPGFAALMAGLGADIRHAN